MSTEKMATGASRQAILVQLNGKMQWCTRYDEDHIIVRIEGKVRVICESALMEMMSTPR